MSLEYAAKGINRYQKLREGAQVRVTEQDIVKEIRLNPELENVAQVIEDPLAYALIRMLITYEKYNYVTEESGIVQAVNLAHDDSRSIFAQPTTDPPFKEIELMKELVLEIGEAISDRIRDDGREKGQGQEKGEE